MSWHGGASAIFKKNELADVVKFVVDGKRECIGLSCAVDVKGIFLAGKI